MGLDSIVALTLVQEARRRGIEMRARLMLECSTIRELAAAINNPDNSGSAGGESAPAPLDDDRYGEVDPAPIMRWMFEYGSFRRFTQNVLVSVPDELTEEQMLKILQALLDRHDMLRSVLQDGQRLLTRAPGMVPAAQVLTVVGGSAHDHVGAEAAAALERIDPTSGSILQAVWFREKPSVLLLCVHHLATDVVSWYIILGALAELAGDVTAGRAPALAAEFTTYRRWTRMLAERSRSRELDEQLGYWARQLEAPDPPLGVRRPDPSRDTWASHRLTDVVTDADSTAAILRRLDRAGYEVRDFLLAALTLTLASWRGERGQAAHHGALIALEGHGREDAVVGHSCDTSATVGWFTSVYPVRLGAAEAPVDIGAAKDAAVARTLLRSITDQLALVPNRGLDYGVLRYLRGELAGQPEPQVEFNYIGRHDLSGERSGADWSLLTDPALNTQLPVSAEPDLPLRYTFDVICVVAAGPAGPQLRTSWRWSDRLSNEADMDRLSELWSQAVTVLGDAL